ncbi:hypothetical protein [Acinetobacter sp. c3-l95]|uniref:hypothetical protein n=1 Tax=Acinetobacter sp. c3-l95 TaxID=3342804 RepID=UPI0035B82483
MLSYRLQSEELQLQRKELANSVQAQQGAEEALKEQSETMKEHAEALKKQLEITSKQYENFIKLENNKRPLFKYSGGISPLYDNQVSFWIKNIKGQCKLLDIQLEESIHSDGWEVGFSIMNNEPFSFDKGFSVGSNPAYNNYDNYSISISSNLYEADVFLIS